MCADARERAALCGALDPFTDSPCEIEQGHIGMHQNRVEAWFYPDPERELRRRDALDQVRRGVQDWEERIANGRR